MTREKIGKMAKKITFFRTKEKTMNFAQNSGKINNVNFMNFKIPTKNDILHYIRYLLKMEVKKFSHNGNFFAWGASKHTAGQERP